MYVSGHFSCWWSGYYMDWVALYASLGARCPVGGVVRHVMDILRAVGQRDSMLIGPPMLQMVAHTYELLKWYIMQWFQSMTWNAWCKMTETGDSKTFLNSAIQSMMVWLIVPSHTPVVGPPEMAPLVDCRGHDANSALCDMVFVVKAVADLVGLVDEHGAHRLVLREGSMDYVGQMAGRLAGIVGDAEMGCLWDVVHNHGPLCIRVGTREVDVIRMASRYALSDSGGFWHYRPLMWDRVAHALFVPSGLPVATPAMERARRYYCRINRMLRLFLLCLARMGVHVSPSVAYDVFEMIYVYY